MCKSTVYNSLLMSITYNNVFLTLGNWWKMWLRGEIFPLGVKMTKMGKNGTISDDSFHLMRSQNEGNHMITECVWNKFQFEHNFLTQYQNRDTKILDPTIFLIFLVSSINTCTESSRWRSEMLNKTKWKPKSCMHQFLEF